MTPHAFLLTVIAVVAAAWSRPAHAQLGGGGSGTNNAPPPEKMAVSPGGVDMRTGHYAYDATDLTIGAGNPGDLSLKRINSLGIPGHVDAFANFASNWDIMITEKLVNISEQNFQHGSGADLEMGVRYGGRSDTFRRYSGSAFEQVSMAGTASLTWTGTLSAAVYTYTASDGTVVTFRPINGGDCSTYMRCAYVSQIVEPDGIKYTLEYDSSAPARLRSVASSRGYAMLFEYSGNNVVKACVLNLAFATKPSNNVCPSGALMTTTYGYTSFAGATKLASVTNASATANFTYGGTSPNFTMGFVKPGDTSPWLTNTYYLYSSDDEGTGEVISRQDFADGSYYTYAYNYMPEITGQPMRIAGGTFTDAGGFTSTVEYSFPIIPGSQNPNVPLTVGMPQNYQTTSGPTTVSTRAGVSTYDYCDRYVMANLPSNQHHRCLVTMLQSSVDPSGIQTLYSYDGWVYRNVTEVRRKPNSGPLADIVTTAQYSYSNPKLYTKPVWTRDALGNQTDYTYDSTHGGVLTETAPADVNGVRPVKRYVYALRYAWLSNGSGGYAQSPDGIWLLTETRTCRTTATVSNACAGGASDETVTSFDYGPNAGPSNLLLRGTIVDSAGTLALRTCYSYDQLGNRISETTPRAGLTSCP